MYPGVLHAPGSAKNSEYTKTYTDARYPLGTLMVTQDGRAYRFAENGAGALASGTVVQSEVPGANFDELAIAVGAVGDKTVTITTGATAVTENMFRGGYLITEDDAGEGKVYGILSHPAAGTTATCVITLSEGLAEAITAATTVSLIKHPLMDVIIHPSPATALVVGVTPVDVAANAYFWAQVHGVAAVLTDGVVVIGFSVMASNAVDGAIEAWGLTEAGPNTEIQPVIGRVISVSADTEYSPIFLTIE